MLHFTRLVELDLIMEKFKLLFCVWSLLIAICHVTNCVAYKVHQIDGKHTQIDAEYLSGISHNGGLSSAVNNMQLNGNTKHFNGDKEGVGQGRFMASYFFPVFPQFYDVDYNDVWNWLKSADTIGYFFFENFLDVSYITLSFA